MWTKEHRRLYAYLLVIATAAFLVWRGENTRRIEARHARESNAGLCQAINENRAGLRNLLVSARSQTPRKQLTSRARRFYAAQIRAIQPLNCGHFSRDSLRRLRQRDKKRAKGVVAPPGHSKQPP